MMKNASSAAEVDIRPTPGAAALRTVLLALSAALLWCSLSPPASAQNLQYTKNSPDLGLRSDLKIDPSTLGMSVQIPLRIYAGRGGASVPVVLNYSSKLWRVEYGDHINGNMIGCSNSPVIEVGTECYTTTYARYAERSASGWTSSVGLPVIEWDRELYDSDGRPCASCLSTGGGYHIKRLRVLMADGSSHEMRASDARFPGDDPAANYTGTYVSVDGSRMRYESVAVSSGVPAGVLYLPDGSRYLLGVRDGAGQPTYKYIDRHGNTIVSSRSGFLNTGLTTHTDTLGRAITSPPLVNSAPGDQTYALTGVNGSASTYTFRWRALGDPGVLTPDPATGLPPPLHYYGDMDASGNQVYSPALFASLEGRAVRQGTFNPVVLHEIVLPDGSLYRFNYNVYGEIDRVTYPTGGYERYRYAAVLPLGQMTLPYAQANRGVVERWVSPSGSGADEQHWAYSTTGTTVTTIPPGGAHDGMRTERDLYVGRAPSQVFYGFDDARAGMVREERVYSAANLMLRRTLTEWAVEGPRSGGQAAATRDPKVTRQVRILLDTGAGNALVAHTSHGYDQPGQPLNLTSVTEYGYDSSMTRATAETAAAQSLLPDEALKLRTTETAYLEGGAYASRNLVALPVATLVKDASGAIVARSETRYDEASDPVIACPGIARWTDPATPALGNVTTTRSGLKVNSTWTWLEAHAQYDQGGNARKQWEARPEGQPRGEMTEVVYTSAYHYAYAEEAISPIPDPDGSDGLNGLGTSLVTKSEYDISTGLVTETTDANGKMTTFSYSDPDTQAVDPFGRLRLVSLPDGGWTRYDYGNMTGSFHVRTTSALDGSRHTESYRYFDGLGRASRSYSYDGSAPERTWVAMKTTYDDLGRAATTSNPLFRSNLSDFDAPADGLTTTEYDDLGRVRKVTSPDGAYVTTSYSGSQVTMTDQALKKRSSVSDALGRLTKVIEAPGVANYGFETSYEYDVLGNLKKVTQGKAGQTQQTRTFIYDSLSRLVSATNPEVCQQQPDGTCAPTPITYEYDPAGNLKKKIDARGVQTEYDYDGLNRVKSRRYTLAPGAAAPPNYVASPVVDYYYDGTGMPVVNDEPLPKPLPTPENAKGLLTAVKSSVSHTVYTKFDVMGRVTGHRQIAGPGTDSEQTYTTGYGYDLAGNLTSQTYPSGKVVVTEYDAAGRVAGVRDDATGPYYAGAAPADAANRLRYAAHGAAEAVRLGNGLWERTQFNSRLQPERTELGTAGGASDRWRLDYGYGPSAENNGNVRSQTVTVPTVSGAAGFTAVQVYGYDALNRIETARETEGTANGAESWKQKFTYDHFGNRRIDGDPANPATSPTTPALVGPNPTVNPANNRLSSPGYTYDAAGNLVSDPHHTYEYDSENLMVANDRGGDPNVATVYGYDGDGRRVRKATANGAVTVFVYDAAGRMVAEYSNAAQPASTGGVNYLTQDQLGSTRVVTGQDGSVRSRHDYLPFGEEVRPGAAAGGGRAGAQGYEVGGVRQKFTGYERDDETGLDYAQARYFSSSQGRYTSTDPLLTSGRVDVPQSWNRYAYVMNNPLRLVDPSGLQDEDPNKKKGFVETITQVLHEVFKEFELSFSDENIPQEAEASDIPDVVTGLTGHDVAVGAFGALQMGSYSASQGLTMLDPVGTSGIYLSFEEGDKAGMTVGVMGMLVAGKPLVIGTGMKEVVRPAALEIGGQVFESSEVGDRALAYAMRSNIREAARKGLVIIDRGSDARRATSQWYRIEVEELKKVGYRPEAKGIPIAQTPAGEVITEFRWVKVK